VLLNSIFSVKSYSIYDERSVIGVNSKMQSVVGYELLPNGFDIASARNSDELFIIKTHDLPNSETTDKVIYVLRDGRESSLSFCKYISGYSDQSPKLLDVIYGNTFSGGWSDHVKAWAPNERDNTLLVKFEELTADPSRLIKEIADFIDVTPLSNKIPTFKELKKTNPKFFREGKTDSWKDEYSESEHNAFWLRHYQTMIEYGYTSDIPELFQGDEKTIKLVTLLSQENNYYQNLFFERLKAVSLEINELKNGQNTMRTSLRKARKKLKHMFKRGPKQCLR